MLLSKRVARAYPVGVNSIVDKVLGHGQPSYAPHNLRINVCKRPDSFY